jgi:hypothetical protein
MVFHGIRARWALFSIASCVLAPRAHAQDSVAAPLLAPPLAPAFAPTFSLHGFIQVYYRVGDPLIRDGFRLRKSDIKFSGDVSPRLKWRVTFDAGKLLALSNTVADVDSSAVLTQAAVDQKTKSLQDAALTYFASRDFNFDIGQQVLPMTLEGSIPSSKMETIERNLFTSERSRAVGLADVRDVGVSANGVALHTIEYHAGIFNEIGDGAGTLDVNQQKSFVGRVSIHPPILPALQFGATGGYEGGARSAQRRRGGTEIQYQVPLFTVRAESMSARDGNLRRSGWYGLGALRPLSSVQLVARYDSWDRDLSNDATIVDAYERQVVLGGSYALDPATKISVNVVRQTFPNVDTIRSGTFVLTAFQAFW